MKSYIKGVGGYLPEKVLTNQDLEKMVDTTDEWIRERTGIQRRHIAAPGQLTSDLAIQAAQIALQNAGTTPDQIDCIIVATTTPDETMPAVATKVQRALGITHGFAFDVQAVCSGFMYALSVADAYIQSNQIKNALVIGAETLSRIVDWTDRGTCILFGDGAGAVVLSATESSESGIKKIILRSDGTYHDLLYASGGASTTQQAGFIIMEGREVFRHAVLKLSEVASEVLAATQVDKSQIKHFVPHQANYRIIKGTADKLGIPMDQVVLTLENQGNTSAASIPLALFEGVRTGRIQRGDLMLIESMGGGLTWAGAIVQY